MENIKETIEGLLYSNPRLLLSLPNNDKVGLKYLPYSLGFEFECDQKPNYSINEFTNISNIVNVNVDDYEQRYRIPNGINGLICLYDISIKLKENSLWNFEGGIHIHCDFTGYFEGINQQFIDDNSDYILSELDKYRDSGSYNKRKVIISTGIEGVWVKFQTGFQTMEVRVFEQSFEYEELVKMAIHVCEIARILKNKLGNVNPEIIKFQKLLNKLQVEPTKIKEEVNIEQIVNRRLIKWTG